MAVRRLAEQQPPSFEFTPKNLDWAQAKIKDYPQGRQASAVIPVLWKAQEQNHGWLPEPAIRLVADMLDMPYIRVFEIATFYTMFQLQPVGSVAHIGVCGTTPCMLRGSDELIAVCRDRLAPHPFELSEDGRFSWEEVECAGACVNAPMVQIGPDTFEDLTAETFDALIDKLASGGRPVPGPQSDRRGSEPITGATTLKSRRKHDHPEGDEAPPDAAPAAGVSPRSPAAGASNAARPDPRDRTEVEATRTGDEPARDPSPVAPEPKTNGRTARAPSAPEKQQDAMGPGQVPDDRSVGTGEEAAASAASADAARKDRESSATRAVESADPAVETSRNTVSDAEANRAAPGAEPAAEPVTKASADIEPSVARRSADASPGEGPGPASAPAGPDAGRPSSPAPDRIASDRADAVGSRPRALSREDLDEIDELQRISGVGPVIQKTLHDLGIFRFAQIADWDQGNKDWVNAYLAFKGRIDRERWVEQAREIVNTTNGGSA